MGRHIKGVDAKLWRIVYEGFTIAEEGLLTPEDQRNINLDAQSQDLLCDYMTKEQFSCINNLESAKGIWNVMPQINEGISTQLHTKMVVLRRHFNKFKRSDYQSVQSTYSRLVTITNELQGLGAKDITNHVVKKLLRPLNESFDMLILMIQSSWD